MACNDYPTNIEVLWELEHGQRVWWAAKVTQRHRGRVILEYQSAHGYETTTAEVNFLPGRVLRHIEGGEKSQETPEIFWRPLQNIGSRQNVSKSRPVGRSVLREAKRLKAGDGKQVGGKRLQAQAPEKNYEMLLLKVEELQRKVELVSSPVSISMCVEQEVLERLQALLRHKIVEQVQKGFGRNVTRKNAGEEHSTVLNGVTQRVVKGTVDCELYLFKIFAKRIRVQEDGSTPGSATAQPVQFIPSFSAMQGPQQGAKSFTIAFPSLASLCAHIGIQSTNDRLQISRTYRRIKDIDRLRLMGTYAYDNTQQNGPAVMFLNRSCGHSLELVQDQSMQSSIVLLRRNRAWSKEDKRFQFPLEKRFVLPSHETLKTTLTPRETEIRHFNVRWRRGTDARPRMWFHELVHPERVAGKLDIVLPCVEMKGDYLCEQVENVLTEEMLIETLN